MPDEHHHHHHHEAWAMRISLYGFYPHHFKGEHMISAPALVGQKATASEVPIPANGTIDPGSVKWIADNPTLVNLTPSADGSSCGIQTVAVGTVNISCQATSNGVPISGTDVIQVVISAPPPPQATGMQLSVTQFA